MPSIDYLIDTNILIYHTKGSEDTLNFFENLITQHSFNISILTFVEKNSMLVREFDKYIFEHPEFADKLPNNTLIVIQLEGDEEFNKWAKKTGQSASEKDTPLVYGTITELKPVRSRIKKLKLKKAA